MPGFIDALSANIRSHTGLHYVPSFNDFVSGSADDAEAMEASQARDHGGGERDQAQRGGSAGGDTAAPKLSNKTDDQPGPSSTVALDIHKVNIFRSERQARDFIDNARGGRHAPSVWEYILSSQGKEKLPTFQEMSGAAAHPATGGNMPTTIGAAELQKHLNVTPSQAEAMVKEADRDRDNRISHQEWEDILNEVSA